METTATSMKIQCNEPTYNLLQEPRGSSWSFATTKRLVDGKHGIKVKGKGLQYTWWINEAIQCFSTTDDEKSMREDAVNITEIPKTSAKEGALPDDDKDQDLK